MNRKFTLSFLFILAMFMSAISAQEKAESSEALISTTIVISQAYGGGGGATGTYMFDYVELKNISAVPQSLNGLSLMYGSATGQFGSTATNIFVLPNITLQPGQYFLVQLSTAGSGGAAFPVAPDATTTNLSMSGTNGKVALVSGLAPNSCGATATPCTLPNAQIIDLVSWGTANNAEGGAPTNGGAALTSTQGNVRKQNGCQDTDNNNNDFDIVTAPVPRNTSTITPCSALPTDAPNDVNGDGKSDYVVVRNTGGGPGGQITWFYNDGTTSGQVPWGISSDFFLLEDFDGDNKDDITVWRPATGVFYILESVGNTIRIDVFGLSGDDPRVVGDYDGDGKADVAVYRAGAAAGNASFWIYRGSLTPGNATYIHWGQNGDFPVPGDFDGDGKSDFVVQRNNGGGQARFWRRFATGATDTVVFGTPTDVVVPGDYDGDGKCDIATIRGVSGQIQWHVLSSLNSSITYYTFGLSATDFPVQGDYDGDGKVGPAIWRPNLDPTQNYFITFNQASGTATFFEWGQNGDYPVANWNAH